MATTICKAIATDSNGTTVFTSEAGHDTPTPIVIRQDDAGVQWYWHLTPEDIAAEQEAARVAYAAWRKANPNA